MTITTVYTSSRKRIPDVYCHIRRLQFEHFHCIVVPRKGLKRQLLL